MTPHSPSLCVQPLHFGFCLGPNLVQDVISHIVPPAISSPDLTGAHLDIAVSKKVDLKASTGPKRQPQQMPCDPKHYTLDASFFTNQDDTQPSILQEITLKSTGVVLANQAEIAPWLQAGHHPKDELAVLLLQPLKPEDFPSYGMTMITCPRMRKATESCCESKW